jgi:regulator of nucleoside diphosphate kinase
LAAARLDMPGAALLSEELQRASIIPRAKAAQVVRLGARVTYRDLDSGAARTLELGLPAEASIDEGRISVLTPIGAALLGLSAGDRFSWVSGAKVRQLEVLAVHPG